MNKEGEPAGSPSRIFGIGRVSSVGSTAEPEIVLQPLRKSDPLLIAKLATRWNAAAGATAEAGIERSNRRDPFRTVATCGLSRPGMAGA